MISRPHCGTTPVSEAATIGLDTTKRYSLLSKTNARGSSGPSDSSCFFAKNDKKGVAKATEQAECERAGLDTVSGKLSEHRYSLHMRKRMRSPPTHTYIHHMHCERPSLHFFRRTHLVLSCRVVARHPLGEDVDATHSNRFMQRPCPWTCNKI